MGNELATTDQQPVTTLQILNNVISQGGSLEHIEKMMELHERNEKNEARKAYHKAFAEFKANPPQIIKDMSVSFGKTAYNHASIGNVVSNIVAALGKYELSHSWSINQDEKGITIKCTITHSLGHSESTSMTAPPDGSGQKNTIQAIASTTTYLQRYTLLAVTGLATSEMDDDGRGSEPQIEKITVEKFITGIKWHLQEKKTADSLEKWLNSKTVSLELLSKEEQDQIKAVEVEVIDQLLTLEEPQTEPEKRQCLMGGIEITAKQCDECPDKNCPGFTECKTIDQEKE